MSTLYGYLIENHRQLGSVVNNEFHDWKNISKETIQPDIVYSVSSQFENQLRQKKIKWLSNDELPNKLRNTYEKYSYHFSMYFNNYAIYQLEINQLKESQNWQTNTILKTIYQQLFTKYPNIQDNPEKYKFIFWII